MPVRTARRGAIAAAVALVALAAVFGPGLASSAWDSFSTRTLAHRADPAKRLTTLNGNRRNIFASAIAAGRAHPLEGVGPGTFEFWWSADARDPEFMRDAHSLYLESFAELGWPGAIATLWLVLALLGGGLAGWRLLRREGTAAEAGAIAAALTAFLVFAVQAGVDWMWESTAVAVLGLAAAGCAVAARQVAAPPRRPARALLAVGAVLAIAVQLPPMVSLSRVRASQRDFRRGDVEAARNAAQEAVDAEPWGATSYVQRGLLEESADDLGAAAADLLRAERAEPTNWRHPLLLARIRAEQEDPAAAIAAYKRARALRPLSPVFRGG
jgi:O-antigen ligase